MRLLYRVLWTIVPPMVYHQHLWAAASIEFRQEAVAVSSSEPVVTTLLESTDLLIQLPSAPEQPNDEQLLTDNDSLIEDVHLTVVLCSGSDNSDSNNLGEWLRVTVPSRSDESETLGLTAAKSKILKSNMLMFELPTGTSRVRVRSLAQTTMDIRIGLNDGAILGSSEDFRILCSSTTRHSSLQKRSNTTSSYMCRPVSGLSTCSQIIYPAYVPSNLTQLDEQARQLIDQFHFSLYQYPCGLSNQPDIFYSPVRACPDCVQAYTDWICASLFPRCDGATTGADSVMRPCRGLCWNMAQSCPGFLEVYCPEEDTIFDSYGPPDRCNLIHATSSATRSAIGQPTLLNSITSYAFLIAFSQLRW